MFKGVIREIRSIRNIVIHIVDISGNTTTFPVTDIPKLIEDLKRMINSDDIRLSLKRGGDEMTMKYWCWEHKKWYSREELSQVLIFNVVVKCCPNSCNLTAVCCN